MCIRSHWKQKCSTLKIQPGLSSHWLISELSWLGSGMCRSALFWLRRNLGGRTWHRSRLNMLTGYWQLLSLSLGWFSFSGGLPPHGALPTLLHLLQQDLWEGWPRNLGRRGLCKTCGEGAPSACWTCGGWPEQQQAGHGCPISAEDEGKGSGLHRCWWRSVWGKKSVNCNVYPSANVLQIVIRNE